MSPAPVVYDIGPQDVDAAAEFGQVGPGHSAKLLLQAHGEMYSPDLANLLALPSIGDSELVIDLDEVQRVAKPNGDVHGAQLKGDLARPSSLIVSYIYITESGRSARGVVSWEKLPDSKAEFERYRDKQLFGQALVGPGGEAVEREAYTSSEVDSLRVEIERLKGENAKLQDPEPYEGYTDATVDDVAGHVRDLDLSNPEHYVEAEQILDYEGRHKDRAGVTEVVEKAIAAEDERRTAAESQGG